MMVRILDIFFYEHEKIIYRIALAIFEIRKQKLEAAGRNFEKLMYSFKDLENDPIFLDPDHVIEIAMSFKFSRKYI
jgi:hypothetical protein